MRTVLAIDVGATNTRVAVYVEGRGLTLKRVFRTPRVEDGVAVAETIASEALRLVKENSVGVEAIGVGSIGPLDIRKGVIVNPPNLPAKNIPLRDVLVDKFGLETFIVNDCVAGVYGEYNEGIGKGVENLVYITISSGIGAGVIVDGHLLLGKDGNAHEVGHLVLMYTSAVRCGCGGLGHWEGFASGNNVWKLARLLALTLKGPETSFFRKTLDSVVSSKEVFDAYYRGDEFAKIVINYLIEINAAGVASVVNAYDPELVVFGGSVVLGNPWIVKEIEKRMVKYLVNKPPRMVVTRFGDDAVLYGAAWIALKPPKHLVKMQGGG